MILYKEREYFTEKDLAMSVISGKWKLPIIYQLIVHESRRLSDFKRVLPDISRRMLIRQLRELEKDQIIKRVSYTSNPPKVEYYLTNIGEKLEPAVEEICSWSEIYVKEVVSGFE